ncbi:MAG: hypothetical protein IPI92_20180 [Gemmatimonadetes bacterium]|jgi:hypothetical protein|nr:hypothetical protein [Gemmatimonadota bacterium]MBK7786965.1 hypothetical protein [Gemmatimonadota bacterium]MBK8759309.1 hypothetical protein [Sulfuritalea sp.]
MMGEYRTVETSAEVWAVIRARHPELRVFGSYSYPSGDEFGDPSKGKMFTSYGFAQADYPLMEAETTWDIELSRPGFRRNEVHQYWLCCPVNGGE